MNFTLRNVRVLVAKPGLDGHDRGAKVLTLGLREEGMDVIYLGIRTTADEIVQTTIQESVDVVALSSLSGGHLYHFGNVIKKLAAEGLSEIPVIGGGIIPEDDISILKKEGIKEVFGPGTIVKDVAAYIRSCVEE